MKKILLGLLVCVAVFYPCKESLKAQPKEMAQQNLGKNEQFLARVKIGNKTEFIDTTGKIVINLQFEYDYAWPFAENGLARVMIDGINMNTKKGYIDTTGRFVITPQYDEAWYFVRIKK